MGILGRSQNILKTAKYLQEASPVFVHLFMVIGVAVYTLFGAIVMRNLESKADPHSASRRSIPLELLLNASRNSSHREHGIRHSGSLFHQRFNLSDLLNLDNSTSDVRVKREFAQVMRSRKCVIGALQKFMNSDCTEAAMNKVVLKLVDSCYHVTVDNEAGLQDVVFLHSLDKLELAGGESQEYIKPWSFSESVLFAFTVITTIGYGNVAPRTFSGRLFCILYGLIGIPFTLLAIADLGKFISEVIDSWEKTYKQFWKNIKKKYQKLIRKNQMKNTFSSSSISQQQQTPNGLPKSSIEEEYRPLTRDKSSMFDATTIEAQDNVSDAMEVENFNEIDVEAGNDPSSPKKSTGSSSEEEEAPSQAVSLLLFFVLYIFIGASLLSSYEPDMTFFKAIYFNFVSLSSIGLGDIYPRSETYMAFTIVYIAIGLALTTIAIEIAADYLKKLHYFGRKIENVGNVAIWFGGKKLTMKQLVRNLGDQFNLPISTIKNLDLDTFVDNAIKVEEGELETLRPPPIEPEDLMIESNVTYADEEKGTYNISISYKKYEVTEEWIPQKTPTPPPKTPTPPPKTPTPEPEPEPTPPKTPTPPPKTPTPPPKTPTPPPREPTPPPPPEPPKPKGLTAAELAAQKRRAYSEEAWRRYQEYQKQWKKFRQTQHAAPPNPKKPTSTIGTTEDGTQGSESVSPGPANSGSASRSSSSMDNRPSVSPATGSKMETSPTPGSRAVSPAVPRSRQTSASSSRRSPGPSTSKSKVSASATETTEGPEEENPKTNIRLSDPNDEVTVRCNEITDEQRTANQMKRLEDFSE
ncbi:hypothetical protein FO519_003289 [Halicephalobus sp. NKZ332]|nr:hypothetical protein FO519_003289 [Halicephalobus sp. NKZ332]